MKALIIRILFLMIITSSFSFSQEEYEAGDYSEYEGYYNEAGEFIPTDSNDEVYYEEGYYNEAGEFVPTDSNDEEYYYEEGYYNEAGEFVPTDSNDEEYQITDEEILTNQSLITDTLIEKAPVEELPKAKTNVIIPLFQNYRLPERVDPKAPFLPYTHAIKKLRGTVWRGSEEVFRPNARGVITTQRLYIFFDKARDAIAYKYISYNSKKNPDFPGMEEFLPLIPLLQTNDFVPITSKSLFNVSKESKVNSDISSELRVDPSFANDLNNETIEENIKEIVEEIETQQETILNEPMTELEDTILTDTIDYDDTEGYEGENEEYEYYDEGYEGENEEYEYYDEEYEGENEEPLAGIADTLFYLPQTMIAQNIEVNNLRTDQYVINVGGDTSGIFVHETNNPNTPYKVILLSFVDGMTLYAYNINNSFDVRNSTSQSSQRARELYINILEKKINMKKFQRVHFSTDFIDF